MKLRIKGNSIRIRLTKHEIEDFGKNGYLEERTEIGNSAFIYALRNVADISELSADLSGNKMIINVPSQITHEWTTTDVVGFNNNKQTGDENELFILIEKDFKCIDNTMEDQSDNYENPNSVCI